MDWGGNYEGGPHKAPWLGGGGVVPGGSDGRAGADARAEGPVRALREGSVPGQPPLKDLRSVNFASEASASVIYITLI